MTKVICDYCGSAARLVDSAVVYGKSYGNIWICSKYPLCDAYVGVHKGTDKPLGRLANPELRKWKKVAHFVFDKLWKGDRAKLSRNAAYAWLSKELGITIEECHIGMFDVDMCKQVCRVVDKLLEK